MTPAVRRASLIGGIAVAAGGVFAILARLQGLPTWLYAVLAALGIAAASVAPVVTWFQQRAERSHDLEDLLVHHPVKRIGSIDPTDVGVARSPLVEAKAVGRGPPPYIEREVDADLRQALAKYQFVVVRGQPKEGKSRTAFEAVASLDGDPCLLAIRSGMSPDKAITQEPWDGSCGRVVLWLDRIDQFMRGSDFTRRSLDRFLKGAPQALVVGTIEAGRWDEIMSAAPGEDYEPMHVLGVCHSLELRSTDAERARAREIYPEESFDLGIGQQFVGAEELRRCYEAMPRDQAGILRAASAWQRAGMPRAIRKAELDDLHADYLGGAERSNAFDDALSEACKRLPSGVQLLVPESPDADGGYRVPDHMVDYIVERGDAPIKPAVWDAAMKAATGVEALALGDRARELDEREVALEAYKKARSRSRRGGDTRAAAALGCAMTLRFLDRDPEAVKYFEEAVKAGSLPAANNYGFMLMMQGDYEQAAEVLTENVANGNRTSAFVLLATLSKWGKLDDAELRFTPGVEAKNPAAALMLGNVKHAEDDLERAEELYRTAEAGTRQIDERFKPRARILRALIAEQRGDSASADALFGESWDEGQWSEIAERLDQVGLTLTDPLERLLARTGKHVSSGGPRRP